MKKKKNIFVSVITPNFNGEKYLEETIKSVLNQTDKNFEYIVMDGYSNDGSIKILEKYKKRIDNIIIKKDNGPYDAVDKGIKIAKGEIIVWINSDDILDKNAVLNVTKIFQLNKDINWISGINGYIKNNVKFSFIPYIYPNFVIKKGFAHHNFWGFIQQESISFRKSLYLNSGGINKNWGNASDFHLWKNFSKFTDLKSFNLKIGYFRSWAGQNSKIEENKYFMDTGVLKNKISFRFIRLFFSLIFIPFVFLRTIFLLSKYKLLKK